MDESGDNPKGGDFTVEPYSVPLETLSAMGRIVMAVAEIDFILSLKMFEVTGLEQRGGKIIVGRMPISGKLRNLDLLRKAYPENDFGDFDKMKPAIIRINQMRNSFAHGVYAGRVTKTGGLLFSLGADVVDPIDGVHANRAMSWQEDQIQRVAESSTALIDAIKSEWGMQGELRGGPLRKPSRKGQKSRRPLKDK